jgi:6-phosphofructo-2-kinase / fructose-2,6-biphosphatase 4
VALCTYLGIPANTYQSYHDLAVRLEPIILELERQQNDLLIIAHESVLRVLYGYLMACQATDIPFLKFPRNEIIEVDTNPFSYISNNDSRNLQVIPASYNNEAKRIQISDVPSSMVPDSPDDIRIPVVMSGVVSPLTGLSTPIMNPNTPPQKIGALGIPAISLNTVAQGPEKPKADGSNIQDLPIANTKEPKPLEK